MLTSSEPGIFLYVAAQKNVWIPAAETLIPIQNDQKTGDHIGFKENYCELRSQYWVWRNIIYLPSDYVGFFHYRRYLDFTRKSGINCPVAERRPLPYRIKKAPKAAAYGKKIVSSAIHNYDVVAPIWEHTGLTVWERYAKSKGHRKSDLELVYRIIRNKYPMFLSAADKYLNGLGEYYGNMYVMRWPLFCSYCGWLFDILESFDSVIKEPPAKTNGFLGERLFGIYFTWLQMQKDISCGEFPRVHFFCYDDDSHFFKKFQFVNMLLPPGSKRREYVRRKIGEGEQYYEQ